MFEIILGIVGLLWFARALSCTIHNARTDGGKKVGKLGRSIVNYVCPWKKNK